MTLKALYDTAVGSLCGSVVETGTYFSEWFLGLRREIYVLHCRAWETVSFWLVCPLSALLPSNISCLLGCRTALIVYCTEAAATA